MLYCTIPKKWQSNKPKPEIIHPSKGFLIVLEMEHATVKSKNPQIKPPVGPIITCAPPLKAENTGKPNAPIAMYVKTQAVDHFADNINPQNAIAKVCNVKGTVGVKNATCESTHITAVNIALKIIFLSLFFN